MPEHLQAIQTTGHAGNTVPDIQLADLLSHPALAGLQPNERAALHLAAEQLERRAAAGVALRLRIARIEDVVPTSLLDARAAVYCTTAPREVHVWVNGEDVIGKSGLTAPVLLQVLAATAGLPPTGEPWAAVALSLPGTLNATTTPLDGEVQPLAMQCSVGESICT